MKGDGLLAEWEAMYFSVMRRNMRSDTAHMCMESHQDTISANVLDILKEEEKKDGKENTIGN